MKFIAYLTEKTDAVTYVPIPDGLPVTLGGTQRLAVDLPPEKFLGSPIEDFDAFFADCMVKAAPQKAGTV